MAISFYTSRVILNALGVVDYGINNVVGGLVSMFTFINSSMALTTSRHLTYDLGKKDILKLKATFKCGLTVHAIIAFIVFILAESIGLWFMYNKMIIPQDRFDAALWCFHLSIVGTIMNIMTVPYNSDVIANEKMGVFAWMSIFDVSIKLAICYSLTTLPYDNLKTYAVLFFVATFIVNGIYILYCKTHFEEAVFGFLWEKNILKEMFSFAGWTLLGQLAFVGFTQGLNLLLNFFFGPSVNAARGIAVQVQGIVYRFVSGFQTAFNPQLTKNYAQNNLQKMHNLLYLSSKFSYYLILLLSIPVIFETHWLLELWLKIVPDYSVSFFRIIIFTSYVEALAYPLIVSAMATGNVKTWNISIGMILLMIVPISYIALKCGASPLSVFIVHLICVVISQIVRLFILRKLISLSIREYVKKVIFPISSVSILAFALSAIIYVKYSSETFSNVITVIMSSVFICLVSIFTVGINVKERNMIMEVLNKKIFKR